MQTRTLIFLLILFPYYFIQTHAYDITYYADSFDWRSTALGDTFRQDGFTAALCDFPLGNALRLSFKDNSVVLKANDRPNCRKHPDLIDVSKYVFWLFAPISRGRFWDGVIEDLGTLPIGYEKRYLPHDAFRSSAITIDSQIPNTYLPYETLHLKGKVHPPWTLITAVLSGEDGMNASVSTVSDPEGNFSLSLLGQEKIWAYRLTLFSGKSGDITQSVPIWVIDLPLQTKNVPVWESFPIFPRFSEIWKNMTEIVMGDELTTLSITQGEMTLTWRGVWSLILDTSDLRSGTASVSIWVYALTTPFSHDIRAIRGKEVKRTLTLAPQYPKLLPNGVRLTAIRKTAILRFRTPENVSLDWEVYVTLPSGDVRQYSFPNEALNPEGSIIGGSTIHFSFPLETEGVYLVEVTDTSGKAWMNTPLIVGRNIWTLLPSPLSWVSQRIEPSRQKVRTNQLTLINTLRSQYGKPLLSVDPILEEIAQKKAQDMEEHKYIWHTDSRGNSVIQEFRAYSWSTTSLIGENVAWWNQGDRSLFEWLKLSGSHLHNILYTEWKSVWIGYTTGSGKVYLVQVFGN